MDDERWRKLWSVFHAASERPADERAAFLDAKCAGDQDLRTEVGELLEGIEASAGFLSGSLELREDLLGASVEPDALVGRRIDVYRIHGVIGEGGMGVVYDAEQESPVTRRVALKLIKLGMNTREVIARFEAERQALALMNHPNIANVLDAGVTDDGRPYFVMDRVAGIPITDYCDRHRLSIQERLALFVALCRAIEHAHQKGIIHRDIKPSNVMITLRDGQPVPIVIDFGVAKALNQRLTEKTLYTQLGRFIGTPQYMSPEQAESSGLDVDTRSDIYSLGVLLYRLLCGALPHTGEELTSGDYDRFRDVLRDVEPRRPSDQVAVDGRAAQLRRSDEKTLRRTLRGELDWVVMAALEKDRTRRYQTASEFAGDVQRYLKNEPVLAGPPSAAYRLRKFVQRHTLGVGMGALIVAMIAAFAAAMAVQSLRLSHALTVADQQTERAQQVSEFLVELFEQSDPGIAGGREITVREVFNRGAEKLTDDLAEQPLVKATLRETLGQVYLAIGDYPASLANFRDALALRRQALGERHPDVARALAHVGRVRAHTGDYAASGEAYALALDIQRATFAGPDPELASTLNEYGFLLMLQGQYDEAEALQLEGLAMRRALLDGRHADIGLSYNDLAITYRRMNEFDTAERYYRQALDIWRDAYGPDHIQVATVHNNLGVLLHVSGRFNAAQAEFEAALAIRRSQLGDAHNYTGLTVNNLAGVYIEKGQFERAEALYREALAIHEAAIGPDSPQTIATRSNVARAMYERGAHAEAEPMLRQILADRLRLLSPDDPQIGAAQTWLARNLLELGQRDEAERLARDALSLLRASLPAGHWRIALAQSTLGRALTLSGRYRQAETMLLEAIEALRDRRGAKAQVTLRSIEHLADLYERSGRPEQAAEVRVRGRRD